MSGTTRRTQPNHGLHMMTPIIWFQRWSRSFTLAITMTVVLWGCATVPRKYVRMAEPGTTLTALIAHPEAYRGKVVLLGGTIMDEEENEQDVWLHIKNRPLDQDYVPHRPVDPDGPEAGYYWVVVRKQEFPRQYRQWGRITVVGQVTGTQRFKTEPVLSLLYMRGWGVSSAGDGVWENLNPNNTLSVPAGMKRN
jgi:starvation-inducible outer membrane lipoprotein